MSKTASSPTIKDGERAGRETKRREALRKTREDVQARITRRTQVDLAPWHTLTGELIDVAKAAEILSLTKRRVRSFIVDGRLPAIRPNKLYLIKLADLIEFGTQSRKSGRPKQS